MQFWTGTEKLTIRVRKMMFTDSPVSSRLTEEQLLSGKLIALDKKTMQEQPELSHVTCTGQWFSVASKLYGKIDVEAVFITPVGHVIIILPCFPSNYAVNGLLSEIKTWTHETLDRIAEKFSYDTIGQSCTVADLLVRHEKITFAQTEELNEKIDECLSSGRCSLFYLTKRT